MSLNENYNFRKINIVLMMLCLVLGILPIFHVLTGSNEVRPGFCYIYIILFFFSIIMQMVAIKKVYGNVLGLLYFNAAMLVLQICFVGAIVPIVAKGELFSLYALISCTQMNLLICLSNLYENTRKNREQPLSGNQASEGPRKVKCLHTFCEFCLVLFGTFLAVLPAVQYFTGDIQMTIEFCTLGCIWGGVFAVALMISIRNVRKCNQMLFPIHLIILLMQTLFVAFSIPVLDSNEFVGIFSFTSSTQVVRFLLVMKLYEKFAEKNNTNAASATRIASAV